MPARRCNGHMLSHKEDMLVGVLCHFCERLILVLQGPVDILARKVTPCSASEDDVRAFEVLFHGAQHAVLHGPIVAEGIITPVPVSACKLFAKSSNGVGIGRRVVAA